MNLSWSNKVIKYVLFVFNLLFVISGIIMIAVGVSVKSYYTDYDIFLNDSYFSLPNLLIAIGSLIFFISFFGCCGAIRESWFMIFIFSVLLSIIFIMEFSAGIAGYVLRDKTTSFLTEELQNSMKSYQFNSKDPNAQTVMWDTIQRQFECCGADKPDDWSKHVPTPASTSSTSTIASSTTSPTTSTSTTTTSNTTTSPTTSTSITTTSSLTSTNSTTDASTTSPTTTTATPTTTSATQLQNKFSDALKSKRQITEADTFEPGDLPGSCCKSNNGATGLIHCNLNSTSATFYTKGCVDGFGDYLKDHAVTLGGVGIAIAFIQLFGVILACHLTKQLKHGFYST